MAGTGFFEYPGIKIGFSFKARESSESCIFDNALEARDSTIMPHYNAVNISRGHHQQ